MGRAPAQDLYGILAAKNGIEDEQMKVIYESLIDHIVKTLIEYGEITLPHFGRLTMKYVKDQNKRLPVDINGNKTHIPEHWNPRMEWSRDFRKCINGSRVTYYEMLLLRTEVKRDRKRMEEYNRQKSILLEREKLLADIRLGRMDKKQKAHARYNKYNKAKRK